MYSPYVVDHMFLYNIVLARFINWPDTLRFLGYQKYHAPEFIKAAIRGMEEAKVKIWGNAYVITTHGQKMAKIDYLVDQVLTDVHERFTDWEPEGNECHYWSVNLQKIGGIGSFLAGQIVADLKNTVGHPLASAPDKYNFVVPGPGSIRGCGWFAGYKNPEKGSVRTFDMVFPNVREYVNGHWPESVAPVDNQDLQNCLCEYDKYCRVITGSGRSKRTYPGL